MSDWLRRIDRAKALAETDGRARALLTQYAAILAAQAACYDALVARGEHLTGSLLRDLPELRPPAAEMFDVIATAAPAPAMRGAPTDAAAIDALLVDGWCQSSIPFLARIVLQPYAEVLCARAGSEDPAYGDLIRSDRSLETTPGRAACPFCGGPPQVSVLRGDGTADGGSRMLICATCATPWPLRRILCVNCGEEDEPRLTCFHAPEFDHVRVDVCETCHRYIKTVDLTRLGLAVPLVDDVASAVLDLWASERGYTKTTPNLIGL